MGAMRLSALDALFEDMVLLLERDEAAAEGWRLTVIEGQEFTGALAWFDDRRLQRALCEFTGFDYRKQHEAVRWAVRERDALEARIRRWWGEGLAEFVRQTEPMLRANGGGPWRLEQAGRSVRRRVLLEPIKRRFWARYPGSTA
jgi:hypothetical protein